MRIVIRSSAAVATHKVLLMGFSGSAFWDHVALDQSLIDGVEIETVLNVQPVLRRCAEVTAKADGRVGGDVALAVHDEADAVRRHADCLSESVDAGLLVLHILEKDMAGMNGRKLPFSGSR